MSHQVRSFNSSVIIQKPNTAVGNNYGMIA